MEDTLYAAAIAIIVGAVAAHSFIWTWVYLRKRGLIESDSNRCRELESRMAQLERENNCLELEVERVGEAQTSPGDSPSRTSLSVSRSI